MVNMIVSYTFSPPTYDGAGDDLNTLQDAVAAAVLTHYPDFTQAEKAWKAYKTACEDIEKQGPELLGVDERLRHALENNPAAASWASCMDTVYDMAHGVYDCLPLGREAGPSGRDDGKEPFGVSLKFVHTGLGPDDKPPSAYLGRSTIQGP